MENQTKMQEAFDAGISLTKKAAERLSAVMEAEGKKGFGLRMKVTTGGCSGMNYDMSFEENKNEFDKVFTSQKMQIYCDLKSYLYLKGIKGNPKIRLLPSKPLPHRTCVCYFSKGI